MLYTEKQSMIYSTRWYLFSAFIFFTIIDLLSVLFLKIDTIDINWLVILCITPFVLMIIFLLISSLELNMKINIDGISYNIIPLINQWNFIHRNEIVSYQVTGRTSIVMHSKNRIKWMEKSKRFIISGKHQLELELTNNRKITLSTHHPKRLDEVLQKITYKK
jgi:hypothetical protein